MNFSQITVGNPNQQITALDKHLSGSVGSRPDTEVMEQAIA